MSTMSYVRDVIRSQLSDLPWEFATTDTFRLFSDEHQWYVRGQANLCLRQLEKDGLIRAVRFGKNNVLIWQKREPRPVPEWI